MDHSTLAPSENVLSWRSFRLQLSPCTQLEFLREVGKRLCQRVECRVRFRPETPNKNRIVLDQSPAS